MNHTAPARSEARRPRAIALVGLIGFLVAILGTLGGQSMSSSAASFSETHPPEPGGVEQPATPPSVPSLGDAPRGDPRATASRYDGAVTEDDGALPDNVTVFGDWYAGIARLDPQLLQALRAAATHAAEDGVDVFVNSGWRSRDYQDQLLREAIAVYGSRADAARWVATADTSPHVSGDAVDIGPFEAIAWLSEHGAAHGLCQIYRNETWHFELRPEAIDRGCPPLYADPTDDPRMQE